MEFRAVAKDDGPKPIDTVPYERHQAPPDANLANFVTNWEHYRGRIVIFLGAGASVGARNKLGSPLPTAYHSRNSLWKTFMAAKPEEFKPEELTLLSLEHAAALVERSAGRAALLRELAVRFEVDEPLWQHSVLPFIHPSAIFTTNYDTMIEDGWALHTSVEGLGTLRPYYRDDNPDTTRHVPLYKPHGTTNRATEPVGEGGLVITQFDYIEMLCYRRRALSRCLSNLSNACVVFIGSLLSKTAFAPAVLDRVIHTRRRDLRASNPLEMPKTTLF
jgi:hypothetical protein